MKDDMMIDTPKIPWYRRRLFWTVQERIAYNLVTAVILVLALYLLFHFVFGFAVIDGDSMYPTLKNKQVVIYNCLGNSYKKGDIVSVRMPSGKFYVKRIIATAGDIVDVQNGQLFINDVLTDEPYSFGTTIRETGNVEYPLLIEPDKYFILGDNRENSNDSRTFGAIIEERITGKVIFEFGIVK